MLQELDNTSRTCGLKINMGKTNIMAEWITKALYVNTIQLDQVEDYIYLVQQFTIIEKNQDNEIRRRIKAGWQTIGRHSTNITGTVPNILKRKSLQPVHPSSNDIWSSDWDIKKMQNKLSAAQHSMERTMLSSSYTDRKTSKWVRNQTKVMDIVEIIRNIKRTWADHISRRTW